MCARRNKTERLPPRAQLYGWTSAEIDMKVRLTRKLAEVIDGLDLSKAREGDTLELPARDALLLIAEGWASPVYDEGSSSARDRAHDRPRRRREKQK
jgi:hypothetical protein